MAKTSQFKGITRAIYRCPAAGKRFKIRPSPIFSIEIRAKSRSCGGCEMAKTSQFKGITRAIYRCPAAGKRFKIRPSPIFSIEIRAKSRRPQRRKFQSAPCQKPVRSHTVPREENSSQRHARNQSEATRSVDCAP